MILLCFYTKIHLRYSSFIDKENARNLIYRWTFSLPFSHGTCHGIFVITGKVSCNAKAGLWTASTEDIIEHFEVTVGSLDEELRLMLTVGTRLKMLKRFGTFTSIDGQIAMEGKALSVEARSHNAEYNTRGSN